MNWLIALLLTICPYGPIAAIPGYKIVDCNPVKFPAVSGIPWQHTLYQQGLLVMVSPGSALPTSVRFTDSVNFDHLIYIYHLFYLGNNIWFIGTNDVVYSDVPSGPFDILVTNINNGLSSSPFRVEAE